MGKLIVDPHNLFIRIVKGRAKRFYIRFGSIACTPLSIIPSPYYDPVVTAESGMYPTIVTPAHKAWNPTNITTWWFAFEILFADRQSIVAYNPITNLGDPTQGILLWYLKPEDTQNINPQNGTFEMTVTTGDNMTNSLCTGVVALVGNTVGQMVAPLLVT